MLPLRDVLLASLLSIAAYSLPAQQPINPCHIPDNSLSINPTANGAHISASGGRPLANLTDCLVEEYGWMLDYEEAPYQVASAFEDTAVPSWHQEHPGKHYLDFKSRKFEVETTVPIEGSMTEAPIVLNQIIERYNAGDNPDRFKLVKEGSLRLSLVVTAVKDDSGNLISREPIMNLPVHMDSVQQSLITALTSLTEQLSQISGKRVAIGTIPMNLFSMTLCIPPVGLLPARKELASILDASFRKFVWSLRFDPNGDLDGSDYALNIIAIAPPAPQEPVRVARAVMAGMALKRPMPVYPEEAKEKHVQGAVILHAIISKTGTVESLDVTSGAEELRDSALTAFRQWTYKPYLLNGQPVEVQTTIVVIYALPDGVLTQGASPVGNNKMPNFGDPNMPLIRNSMGSPMQATQNAQARAEQDYKDGRIVPMQIGDDVTTPIVIWKPSPKFSEEARKAKFEGNVTVNLIVNSAGIPLNVHVTKGVGMGLDEKAIEVVKQYRFKPAMQNGKPVAVSMNVEVNFKTF